MSGTAGRGGARGILAPLLKAMGIDSLSSRIGKGLSNAKNFLGNAWRGVSKIAGTMDHYAGLARNVVGAVAPVAGALTAGPVGSAVGAGLGVAMKGLSAYDSLKHEAMGHMAQASTVAAAAKRGLG